MKSIIFKVNDFQYHVNEKVTIIQACLKNNIDIPRFCYHEKLAIAGNCRMCLVEDLKQIKPLASCAVNISNSMNIYTNTVKVKKARESVLSFLLANHPLDCPICDQGGECDLQDQSIVFGGDRGRFYEHKRSVEDKDCGPLIKTVMNRCIHCTRCVRFSSEIAGAHSLGTTGRGSKMEIGLYIESLLNNEISGNIIDLCPVGALTSKPFAFSARSWELKGYDSVDVLDSLGSNIRIDVRGTKIIRVLPRVNDKVNEDWITDKIRFCYDGFRRQRLYEPMIKSGSSFIKVSWEKALYFVKHVFISRISAVSRMKTRSLSLNCFKGPLLDNESLLSLKHLIHKTGSNLYNYQGGFGVSSDFNLDFREFYSFGNNSSVFDLYNIFILVGMNLRVDAPLLNLKLRRSFYKKGSLVYNVGFVSNFNFFVKSLGLSLGILVDIFQGLHWICNKMARESMKSVFICHSVVKPHLFFHYRSYINSSVGNLGAIDISVFSSFISDFSRAELNLDVCIHPQNNNINGFVNYIVGFDVSGLKKIVGSDSFTIYQGHHGDLNVGLANVILPSSLFVEKESSYTNLFGLTQTTNKAIFNVGNSRDDWKIITAISYELGVSPSATDSLFKLRLFLSKFSGLFSNSNIDKQLFSLPEFNFGIYGVLKRNLLLSHFNNFYSSDTVSRSSRIMSLCASRFRVKNFNFVI